MKNLERQLENLYIQKNKIEEEIELLKEKIKEEKQKTLLKKDFTKDEKIELFKSLFVARFDIYAKKWISRDGNKQGFYPVTATFQGEDYLPLTNHQIEEHSAPTSPCSNRARLPERLQCRHKIVRPRDSESRSHRPENKARFEGHAGLLS